MKPTIANNVPRKKLYTRPQLDKMVKSTIWKPGMQPVFNITAEGKYHVVYKRRNYLFDGCRDAFMFIGGIKAVNDAA